MIPFSKYSGCGNDFIIIESKDYPNTDFSSLALRLCPRKTSIGADGLIVISPSNKADFKYTIYNADGSEAEMCGNGLRSSLHYFAKQAGKGKKTVETHERILTGEVDENYVSVTMGEILDINLCRTIEIDHKQLSLVTMNTGVPHALLFVKDVKNYDVERIGRTVRYHAAFSPKGTNFNACEITKEGLSIRTYERGVEGETLACGTGATAAAAAANLLYAIPPPIQVRVHSGDFLKVDFQLKEKKPCNVTLSGPALEIFKGYIP